jgi:DNA-binding MarR family transcriptional regulator
MNNIHNIHILAGSNYKLVMNNRTVDTSIKILRTLLDQNSSVNKIILQTSSDRSHVLETIKTLERSHLVVRMRSPTHKQMKIIQFTELGHELALFMHSINQYQISYSKFLKVLRETFDIDERVPGNILKKELLGKNWPANEIFLYKIWIQEARDFAYKSAYNFITAISARYFSLLFKFRTNNVANTILTKIFTNALNEHFLAGFVRLIKSAFPPNNISTEKEEQIIKIMLSQLNRPILQYVLHFSHPHGIEPIKNRFISKESSDVVSSIYKIIEPSGKKDILSSVSSVIRFDTPS